MKSAGRVFATSTGLLLRQRTWELEGVSGVDKVKGVGVQRVKRQEEGQMDRTEGTKASAMKVRRWAKNMVECVAGNQLLMGRCAVACI